MLLALKDWIIRAIDHLSGVSVESADAENLAEDTPAPAVNLSVQTDTRPRDPKQSLRILVVEDDFVSRLLMQKLLSPYGQCDVSEDGIEAIESFRSAWERSTPYDLICLDIMMPNMDGQEALKIIRSVEEEKGLSLGKGVKIIMTTALSDSKNIFGAFNKGCESYINKPIDRNKLISELKKLELIE